ncbi:hypothetical protein GCM10023317_48960 [Actinopolymorpha pittospori]
MAEPPSDQASRALGRNSLPLNRRELDAFVIWCYYTNPVLIGPRGGMWAEGVTAD